MENHWIYHPDHPAKVVDSNEYERLLDAGWHESPANFPSVVDSGLAKAPRKIKKEKVVSEDSVQEEPVVSESDSESETDHDENHQLSTDEKIETNVMPDTVGRAKRKYNFIL